MLIKINTSGMPLIVGDGVRVVIRGKGYVYVLLT